MSLKLGLRNKIRRSRAGGFTGLLDQSFASGATAAYSVRLLSSTHSGGIIRVREDAANTEQDFTASEITDGTLASFCGSANGLVTVWYDQSGNGNDASNSTASEQPKIYDANNGLVKENGKAALDFDGRDDELILNIPIKTPLSLFAVHYFNVLRFHGIIGNFDVSDNIFYRFIESGDLEVAPSNSSLMETSINKQQQYISDFHLNSTLGELYVDNTQKDTNNGASNTYSNNPFTIGNSGPDSENFLNGEIQELIIYDDNNKLSERADIYSNINGFYR
jgi:hypothetical protein